MKKIILYFAILFTLFTFYQCNKCKSRQVGKIWFSESDYFIVPYIGGEILIFKNNSGDSIIIKCVLRQSDFNDRQYLPDDNPDDECPGNFYLNEINKTTFTGDNYITIHTSSPYNGHDFYKFIHFYFGNLNSNKFNKTYSFASNQILKNPYNNNTADYPIFHDSLSLGTKVFYNSYELNFSNSITSKKLYYNYTQGILGFTIGSENWYLYKIEK